MDNSRVEPVRAVAPPDGWDCFLVVVATDPARSPGVFAELGAVVGSSTGGVLVRMEHPTPWPGGPVVGVAPRRNRDGATGAPCWLGPLVGAEQDLLVTWLRRGGPAVAAVPGGLRHRLLRPLPAPRLQTAN